MGYVVVVVVWGEKYLEESLYLETLGFPVPSDQESHNWRDSRRD